MSLTALLLAAGAAGTLYLLSRPASASTDPTPVPPPPPKPGAKKAPPSSPAKPVEAPPPKAPKVEAPPPKPKVDSPPKPAAQGTISDDSEAGGLLIRAIRAGQHERITWTPIRVEDITVIMAADAVRARVGGEALRLPITYAEQIEAARAIGAISPSKTIIDAAYRQSDPKAPFVGLTASKTDLEKMGTMGFVRRFNAQINKARGAAEPDQMVFAGKAWIIDNALEARGAVNYGAFDRYGQPIQTICKKHCHGPGHYDYSQLLWPVRREAIGPKGEPIDLLDWMRSRGIREEWLRVYR